MAMAATSPSQQPKPSYRRATPDQHQMLAGMKARADELLADLPESWWDFGAYCPVDDAMSIAHDCAKCGARPVVRQDSYNRVRVGCAACQVFTATALQVHVAAADWNRGHHSVDPPWRDCPFFGLEALSEEEAALQLSVRREALGALASWLKASLRAGNRHGRKYVGRMVAYAEWAAYAHRQFLRQTGRMRYARKARQEAASQGSQGEVE